MQLYEIIIPIRDNNGNRWPEATTDDWEECLLNLFGGFTSSHCSGAWINKSGKRFDDASRIYRVASDQDDVAQLVTSASRRFLDQETFFVALVGSASILRRSDCSNHKVVGEAWIRAAQTRLERDVLDPKGTVA